MVDRPLFVLNERIHTGHLREAGSELADYGVRVSEWGYDRTINVNPATNPFTQQEMIRLAVNSSSLPIELRKSWQRADYMVSRLLVSAHAMIVPPQLIDRATEPVESNLEITPKPISYRETVLSFFEDKFVKFYTLRDAETQGKLVEQMGSINWLSLVYAESQVLKAATHYGAFLIENN